MCNRADQTVSLEAAAARISHCALAGSHITERKAAANFHITLCVEAAACSYITLRAGRLLSVFMSLCLEASHITLCAGRLLLVHTHMYHTAHWQVHISLGTRLLPVHISHCALGCCCCSSHITLCTGRLTYHWAQGCCRFSYHSACWQAAAGSHITLSATGCFRFTYTQSLVHTHNLCRCERSLLLPGCISR